MLFKKAKKKEEKTWSRTSIRTWTVSYAHPLLFQKKDDNQDRMAVTTKQLVFDQIDDIEFKKINK